MRAGVPGRSAPDRLGARLGARRCRPARPSRAGPRRRTLAAGRDLRGTPESTEAATIDPRWLDQLTDLGVPQPFTELEPDGLGRGARVGRYLTLHHALSLAGFLQSLPVLARLYPLPGTTVRGGQPVVPANGKMLARIRSLLAKAEATEFPEEAEALSGKAQELMAKFSLDSALLEADVEIPDDSAGRRLWVDTPYVSAKAQLVGAVASANRCRTVVIDALAVVTDRRGRAGSAAHRDPQHFPAGTGQSGNACCRQAHRPSG